MRQFVAPLILLMGCHSENPYREPARAILEQRCGKCHRADSPDANDKALAVFTLNNVDFAAHMNHQQLTDALGRFTGEIAPADDVSDGELQTMRAFIAAEQKRHR